jgi:hypothetical protein
MLLEIFSIWVLKQYLTCLLPSLALKLKARKGKSRYIFD